MSLACSWVEVESARSEGKTALITGLVRRPTRPSCTASDAVMGYVKRAMSCSRRGMCGRSFGWGTVRFEIEGRDEKMSEWSYIAGEI